MAMNGMTTEQIVEFNRSIIEEFRANGGACGGRFDGNPMLLLTMTGAKSGRTLTTPLTYHEHDGTPVVMASAGGHPDHPQWYYNVSANPEVDIEIGSDRYEGLAVPLSGDARQDAFVSLTASMPRFADYQAGVEREIPIVRLERRDR